VGPRTGLDAVSKRKLPSPCRESNPDYPIIQPVATHMKDMIHKEIRLLKRMYPVL
jgi:hypothetical protein